MDFRTSVRDVVVDLKHKAKNGSIYTRWFWYILAGIVGLATVAFLVYEAQSKSRKAIEALHQRDVSLAKKEIAKVDESVATKEKEKVRLLKKAEKHLATAQKHRERVTKLETRAKTNQDLLDSLENWDDVEKHIKY